jgi:hypothetical protein
MNDPPEAESTMPVTLAIDYTIPVGMPREARGRILDAYSRLVQVIAVADALRPMRDAVLRTVPLLANWDRAHVLQQIEEASGRSLSAGDSLPDSLIATAQAIGLQPHELGVWLYETGHDYGTGQLCAWARRNNFGHAQGEPPEDGEAA